MVSLRVGALIMRHEAEPEILLVRHRRRGRSYAVLPGGKIEEGETIEQAFIREVREESGLDVTFGSLLFIADMIAPGGLRHVLNLVFHGTVVGGKFRPILKGSPSPIEQGDQAYFVPLSRLAQEDLYPPLAAYIEGAFASGFGDGTQYLGNIWKEFEDGARGGQ